MSERNPSCHRGSRRPDADHRSGLSACDDRPCRRDLPVERPGQPDRARWKGDRVGADRPGVHQRQVLPRTPVGDARDPIPRISTKTTSVPYNAVNSMGSNLGPTNRALIDRVKGDVDRLKQENPAAPVTIDQVTTSASGLDPAHHAGGRPVPAAAGRQGAQSARGPIAPTGQRSHRGPSPRHTGRAARQRARAQSRGRRARDRTVTERAWRGLRVRLVREPNAVLLANIPLMLKRNAGRSTRY